MMKRVLLSFFFLPAAIAADDHILLEVACKGNVPQAIRVTMKKPDQIVVPLMAVFLYCEELHKSGKPL